MLHLHRAGFCGERACPALECEARPRFLGPLRSPTRGKPARHRKNVRLKIMCSMHHGVGRQVPQPLSQAQALDWVFAEHQRVFQVEALGVGAVQTLVQAGPR
jgi:hypothetical protein